MLYVVTYTLEFSTMGIIYIISVAKCSPMMLLLHTMTCIVYKLSITQDVSYCQTHTTVF